MKYNLIIFISKLLLMLGLTLIIGTAGASDLGTISWGQILVQGIVGVIMMLVGVILGFKMEVEIGE